MANVLVFAETRGTALRKVAFEAVTAARALADATGGGEVHALVAGPSGVGAARVAVKGMELPPDRPAGRIIGEGPGAVPELIRLLQTEAKVL